MKKEIIEFGRRMDAAEDKKALIDFAEGFTSVLDLGAGTGKISREIAEKWGAHVDSVDLQFKDNYQNTEKVTYYSMDINDFLAITKNKYDCIILSAVLHELADEYIYRMLSSIQDIMLPNCRIIIREPFIDNILGPVAPRDFEEFVNLVKNKIPAGKAIEFAQTPKLNSKKPLDINDFTGIDWVNLCFTLSYGEASWEREKRELRYARYVNWCKDFFNFPRRPFTGFQIIPSLDKTYREHFITAGLPGEAFDLIQYTGMLIIVDYSKSWE